MEHTFDAYQPRPWVERLDHPRRVAFLLSVAGRLVPNYRAFQAEQRWGDSAPLASALETGWAWLKGGEVKGELRAGIATVEAVTPDAENHESELVSAALDAAVCCALLLEVIESDSVDKVIEAATIAYDTVDMYVDGNSGAPGPEIRERDSAHPMRQQEVRRQREDLETLAAGPLTPDLVAALEDQWRDPERSNIGIRA